MKIKGHKVAAWVEAPCFMGGMTETPKKQTRVSFVGVSNLPPQKANELGAALQRIVAAAAQAHNACDDPRIDVNTTFKQLEALTELRDVVTRVSILAAEEAALGTPTLRAELDARAQKIAQHADSLHRAFAVYEENHPQRGGLANGIFQSLLHLAQETVELLRLSDRGACAKLAALVNSGRAAVLELRNANSAASLQLATHNLREMSTTISKRFQRRAELFDRNFEQKVSSVTTSLELATASLPDSSKPSASQLDEISKQFSVLDELALCSPEFGVVLEVEYYEDKTGLNIAALLEALRKGDKDGVVKHTRDLASHVQGLVQDSQRAAASLSPAEKEKVQNTCDEVNAAMLDMVKTSKRVLEPESSPTSNSHLAQQQANAAQRLRKAVANLPTRQPLTLVRDKRRLAEAARGLMETFTSIVAPLNAAI